MLTYRSIAQFANAQRLKNKRDAFRRLTIESLETRRLMTFNWRNAVDSLDVNADGVISPVDALLVVNRLNSSQSRQLPNERPAKDPYLDVTGDYAVSPLDALLVVNLLNSDVRGRSGQRVLSERAGKIAHESNVTVTLGQDFGARNYRVQIDAAFDTTDQSAALEDLLAVYLVDPANAGTMLLHRGSAGSAIFTLAGSRAETLPGVVSWDGSILSVDLTSIVSTRDTAQLKFQLLSSDGDSGTRVTIKPLSNLVDELGEARSALYLDGRLAATGPVTDLAGLAPNAAVETEFENVRFHAATGRYSAELKLRNNGSEVGQTIAVAFPNLPSGVTLRNPSGMTAAGAPYINFKSAIPRGGLKGGILSDRVLVEFDDPTQTPFVLKPQVLTRPNRAPVIESIATQSVMPGGILRVPLKATDADGDRVTFSIDGRDAIPTGELVGNTMIFRPAPTDIGSYTFDVLASDGLAEVKQTVTLNVIADPVTTTRVSGKVLKINGDPIVGMHVEIGAVQGLTIADGSFTLDLGSGAVVSDTIKIRGERYVGSASYPFIAEKLPFLLEHRVYSQVNNVIDRPIYLPELDIAGGTSIDPLHDTTVKQEVAPGELAEVYVAAGTLMNQQGSPFTGTLSITEVPPNLTPAALPDNLSTNLVVTIQPGEMVFARPAPLVLPNRAGYPAGKILDLWSINPVTGEFEDVGDMQVSADGKSIETISGGIRNSSWHFAVEPPIASPQRAVRYNPKQGCPAVPVVCPATSGVDMHSGVLTETHDLVTYQSQGQQRGVQLVYDSMRADPRPILHFGIDEIDAYEIFPFDVDRVRFSAHLSVQRGDFTLTVPGAENIIPPRGGFGGGFNYNLPDDSHFWKLPEGRGAADGALQIDLREQPTGVYSYDLDTGVYFFRRDHDPYSRTRYVFFGSSSQQVDSLLVVNAIDSPFGAGWGITGWQQIVEGTNRKIGSDEIERSAMIVDGGGTELVFKLDASTNKFISPPGDFSVLEKLGDGTYRRTMPDHTVYQFNSRMQLATMTDRNHNVTIYNYDGAGKLISITDPVGLVTTFTYIGNRVTTITDPVGRQTKLTYDSVGNLTRVTDPDDSMRTWRYDAEHHMTGETDQLGRTEQSIYDFHGRVTKAIRKDGSTVIVNAPAVQGLLLPEATHDFENSPRMARLTTDAQAIYVDGNGNMERTSLDGAGQALWQADAIGVEPSLNRDENNLPVTQTSARGFLTSSTFDDRGNLLTTRDSLSVRLGDEPGLIGIMTGEQQYLGETAHFTFQGQKGEELYIDAVQGSRRIQIVQTSDEAAYVDYTNLPEDGAYRIDIQSSVTTGNFAVRLLATDQLLNLPLNARVNEQAPGGQDFLYRVSLLRNQRLRIEDHSPSDSRYWYGTSVDQRGDLRTTPTSTPGIFEGVATADGEYLIYAVNPPQNDIALVPFSFTATVITPPRVAKSGLAGTHSGTLQPGEEIAFPFSVPAGTVLYLDYLRTAEEGFAEVTVQKATGTDPAEVTQQANAPGGEVYRFTNSGDFKVLVANRTQFAATPFSFRLIDLASAAELKVGDLLNGSLQGGDAAAYRLSGTPGQRIIARTDTGNFSSTFASMFVGDEEYLATGLSQYQLLTVAGAHEQYVIFDSTAETESFQWESFDARRAKPLTLDEDLRGKFTTGDVRKYYRFTADFDATSHLADYFFERLDSNITNYSIFSEAGQYFGSSFSFSRSISLGTTTFPPETSHEYFLVASMDEPQYLPHDFGFQLRSLQESSANISIGQTVTDRLDWVEQDTYSFEGRAGQWLYYDARSYDATVDYSVSVQGVGPSGNGVVHAAGRGADGGPFQLSETGTYRIELKSLPQTNEAVLHRDYAFRLLDLNEAPFASLASPLTPQLSNGASVATYRFAATTGQRVTFTQTVPATTSLRVYSARGQLLKDSSTDPAFTMTFSNTETYYLVVAGLDESVTASVASTWTITSANDPAVIPSGFGTFEGTALNDDTLATFQANAGDRILFQRDGSSSSISLRVVDASGATVADLSHDYYSNTQAPQYLTMPRSGVYTIKAVSIQSFTAPYRFKIARPQDLPTATTGSEIAVPIDYMGLHFKFTGSAGQRLFMEMPLPDDVDDRYFVQTGFSYSLYDPISASSVPIGLNDPLPRSGEYVLHLASERFDDTIAKMIDLASLPRIQMDMQVSGTRSKVHETELFKFSATAKEKRLFQFNNPNWYIVNLSNDNNYVSLSLASREISPGNIVWEGVAEFPDNGDYVLVGAGRFASPLDYTALMTSFSETTFPLSGGQLSQNIYTYDPTFNQVTSVTDEQGRKTLFDIDPANGNVRSVTQVIGTVGGGDDLAIAFTYTASGQIDTATDPLGRVTDYDYDAQGRIDAITSAKGTPLQATQQFQYDAAGNPTASIDANGHRTTFAYDALNRITRITEPDPDGAGPLAAPVTQLSYDAVGNVTTTTDAAGQVARQVYDSRDRMISSTDANNQTNTYTYDQNGNVVASTDPLGRVSRMRYDARNRMIASIDPAGFETRFGYDLDNNLVSLTDASGNVTRYTYDARGRRLAESDPYNKVTTFAYNGVNELVSIQDRLERITKFDFDDAGRLTRERWFDATGALVNTVQYSFDAASRIVRIQDGVTDVRVEYDALDRITREESGGVAGIPTSVLASTYDAVGNLLTTTDTIQGSIGGTNTYFYDSLDRRIRQTQTSAVGSTNPVAPKRVDFAYNVLSQPISIARFSDLAGTQAVAASTFTYDTLNRLTDLSHRGPLNTVLNAFALTYDAASRITRIVDVDGATNYTYDTRDQLTGANHADAANPDETYTYDATGNRKSSHLHGTNYTTAGGNRLTSDGTNSYEYDAEGNLVKQITIATGAVREFLWDQRNRLVRVTDRPNAAGTATQVVNYVYDAMDRRIAKTVGSVTTYFVYDGDDVLVDLVDPDGSGPVPAAKSMRYLHGPAVDQVMAQEDTAGQVFWDLTDHLGTVQDLVNNSGQVVNHLKYDSFGNLIMQSNPSNATRYQYTGREFDAETALQYNRARYYDATIGKFLNEDPIGFEGESINLYRYVDNRVTDRKDPEGNYAVVAAIIAIPLLVMAEYAYTISREMHPNSGGTPAPNASHAPTAQTAKPHAKRLAISYEKQLQRDISRLRIEFDEARLALKDCRISMEQRRIYEKIVRANRELIATKAQRLEDLNSKKWWWQAK